MKQIFFSVPNKKKSIFVEAKFPFFANSGFRQVYKKKKK